VGLDILSITFYKQLIILQYSIDLVKMKTPMSLTFFLKSSFKLLQNLCKVLFYYQRSCATQRIDPCHESTYQRSKGHDDRQKWGLLFC
jgi:hypothetical protein